MESEISWLLLFSVLDIILTWALLYQGGGRFVESNPIANWFLRRFDIVGLVVYKLSLIAMVIVIAEIVERLRRGWGRFVLRVGIVAAALVVFYSAWLNLVRLSI